MRQFGTSDILTGYIKQLLAAFNLPTVKIYTKAQEEYFYEHFEERDDILMSSPLDGGKDDGIPSVYHIPYIKDGKLQEYLPDGWHAIGSTAEKPYHVFYNRGDMLLNHTKRFQIKNNIYDQYTHEYLGDYLRFIRDYDNINLMPLYNCFSNTMCGNLKLSFVPKKYKAIFKDHKLLDKTQADWTSEEDLFSSVSFDSSNQHYKIYMLPVKLFQRYTIAIDSTQPIEMFCGLYNSRLEESTSYSLLQESTYMKVGASQFSKPFLYTGLADLVKQAETTEESLIMKDLLIRIAQRESELKLFLKVPSSLQSTITVLEGEYSSWNDFSVGHKANSGGIFTKKRNHTVISNEALLNNAELSLVTPLSLLMLNTGAQVPFADRLIEYLLGNCITGDENELRGNIIIAQKMAKLYYRNANRHISMYRGSGLNIFKCDHLISGVWDDTLRKTFYKQMCALDNQTVPDVLGYVDKDVEKYFCAIDTNGKKRSMMSVDLWEDEE